MTTCTASPVLLDSFEPLRSFEAPYLIDKLLKERIADAPEEGKALFAEVKKYLFLSHRDQDVVWSMYSRRVDEVWHQFVLFTAQYVEFCQRFFGEYLHHNPSNAPETEAHRERRPSTFEGFCARYESVFGEPLPEIWLDDRAVSLSRRLIHDGAGFSSVSVEGNLVALTDSKGRSDVVVNDIALDALAFISCTGSFYVRELPGALTNEEKVGLAATLVEHGILRLAP